MTTSGSSSVSVISMSACTVSATAPVGSAPFGLSVSPDGSRVDQADNAEDPVSVLGESSVTTPVAPTDLIATPSDGSATISIAAGSDGGASKVRFRYPLDEELCWVDTNGTTSPLVIPGFVNYTTYSIKLRAVNSAGNGAPSSSVSTTPAYAAPVQSAPTVGGARRSILASWSLLPVNAQHDRIKLYRAAAHLAGTNTKVRTCMGGATETSCEMKGLTIGTAYDVRIEAVHLAGTGPSKTVRRSLLSASRSITLQ